MLHINLSTEYVNRYDSNSLKTKDRRSKFIAIFTVILALIPMAFVSGKMGPFKAPIHFNAPLAMLTSLIIAYTVVTYLADHWLKKHRSYL